MPLHQPQEILTLTPDWSAGFHYLQFSSVNCEPHTNNSSKYSNRCKLWIFTTSACWELEIEACLLATRLNFLYPQQPKKKRSGGKKRHSVYYADTCEPYFALEDDVFLSPRNLIKLLGNKIHRNNFTIFLEK